jgi:hypothetical protein
LKHLDIFLSSLFAPGFFDVLQHLIETGGGGSQRLDICLRHPFGTGMPVRLHEARYPIPDFDLPTVVGIARHCAGCENLSWNQKYALSIYWTGTFDAHTAHEVGSHMAKILKTMRRA